MLVLEQASPSKKEIKNRCGVFGLHSLNKRKMENIIFMLVGGLIIFFCLTSKKTKKIALYSSLVYALIIIVGLKSPQDYQKPENFSKEYVKALAGNGKTLAQAGIRLQNQTQLEQFGDFLVATSGLAVIFGLAVLDMLLKGGKKNKIYAKRITYKCLALFMAAAMYLLSLYAGLELLLVPWIKRKKQQREKELKIANL